MGASLLNETCPLNVVNGAVDVSDVRLLKYNWLASA
jgi:hypothetical protein